MTSVATITRVTREAPEFTGGEIYDLLVNLRPASYPACADWQLHIKCVIQHAVNFGGNTIEHKNGRAYITPVPGKPGSFYVRTLPITWE